MARLHGYCIRYVFYRGDAERHMVIADTEKLQQQVAVLCPQVYFIPGKIGIEYMREMLPVGYCFNNICHISRFRDGVLHGIHNLSVYD